MDILKNSASTIRNNPDLMKEFLELYSMHFGKLQGCTPCSFNRYYNNLKSKLLNNLNNNKEGEIMGYVLKKKTGEILWYIKDKLKYRRADTRASQEFLKEYLTHGTKEEIEDRKKRFKSIPNVEAEAKKVDSKSVETDVEKSTKVEAEAKKVGAVKKNTKK